MSLLSPIFGGSPSYTRTETREPEPTSETSNDTGTSGTSQPQQASEPETTKDSAAPSTTSTQATGATQGATPEQKAAVSARSDATSPQAKEEQKASDSIANDRRAAQQRLEEARVNMLFEQVSPVATSPAQGIKSYMETLVNSRAAEPAPAEDAAPTAAAA